MLMAVLYFSMISVSANYFDDAKEKSARQLLILPQRKKLNSVLFPADCMLRMARFSTSVLYFALFKAIYVSYL